METNKFQERCKICEKIIPPNEGVFDKESSKWFIRHRDCTISVVRPTEDKKEDIGVLSPEQINFLFENRNYCYSSIWKRLSSLNFGDNGQIRYLYSQSIFEQSFEKYLSYLSRNKFKREDILRENNSLLKSFAAFCRIEVHVWIEKEIDEQWYRRLSFSQRKMGLKPPSYYYHKRYRNENKERINTQRRLRYKTIKKLKIQKKEYRKRNQQKIKISVKEYQNKNREKINAYNRARRIKKREEMLST